jgi:hypothetical protein
MDCSPGHQEGCEGKGQSKCLDNLPVVKVQNAVAKALGNF